MSETATTTTATAAAAAVDVASVEVKDETEETEEEEDEPRIENGVGAAQKVKSASVSNSIVMTELTKNIQYMKLLHELKATFPTVPDSMVKRCVIKVSPFSCILCIIIF